MYNANVNKFLKNIVKIANQTQSLTRVDVATAVPALLDTHFGSLCSLTKLLKLNYFCY